MKTAAYSTLLAAWFLMACEENGPGGVSGSNRPPRLDSPGNIAVEAGKLLAIPLSATDPDGDSIEFRLDSPFQDLRRVGKEFVWYPSVADTGIYPIVLRAIDKGNPPLSDSAAFTVTIKPPTPAANGLALHWDMNEGGVFAGMVYDKTGNGNDGYINEAEWVPGKEGKAVDFAAHMGGSVFLSERPSMDLGSNFTVSLWARFHTLDRVCTPISFGNFTGEELGFLFQVGGGDQILKFRTRTGSGDFEVRGPALRTGEWIHLAAVKSPDSLFLYVDGARVSGTAAPGSLKGPFQIWLGREFRNTVDSNDGSVDELRIFKRALSAAEVAADRMRF